MKYGLQILLTHEAGSSFVFTRCHLESRGAKIQKMMSWVQNSRDVQVTGGQVRSERSGPDSGLELGAAGSFSAESP